jgi:hypothetical protein
MLSESIPVSPYLKPPPWFYYFTSTGRFLPLFFRFSPRYGSLKPDIHVTPCRYNPGKATGDFALRDYPALPSPFRNREEMGWMQNVSIDIVKALLNVPGGPVHAGGPLFSGSLGVLPLFTRKEGALDYLTYEEALREGTVEVVEVSEAGSVPELLLANNGDRRVLVIDGEQLVGAKQNRIMNTTVMAEARVRVVIPVSCVEQGRWHYEGKRRMSTSRASLYAGTRAAKSRQVNRNLRMSREYCEDQHVIWRDISGRLAENGVHSPTVAMDEHYSQRKGELGDFSRDLAVERFNGEGSMVGAVFTLAGAVMGLDLFDRPPTLEAQWDKLLGSYAIEALRTGEDGSVDDSLISGFLRAAGSSKMEEFDSVGTGTDVRITGDTVVGGALVVDGEIPHLYAFQVEAETTDEDALQGGVRMARYRQRLDSSRRNRGG